MICPLPCKTVFFRESNLLICLCSSLPLTEPDFDYIRCHECSIFKASLDLSLSLHYKIIDPLCKPHLYSPPRTKIHSRTQFQQRISTCREWQAVLHRKFHSILVVFYPNKGFCPLAYPQEIELSQTFKDTQSL